MTEFYWQKYDYIKDVLGKKWYANREKKRGVKREKKREGGRKKK